MSYDSAGNLTADKDGYEYQYDYENRIVKITKDGNDIAEFAYDCLGRRLTHKGTRTPCGAPKEVAGKQGDPQGAAWGLCP